MASGFKPLHALLSTFKNIWRFSERSSERHNKLVEMSKILDNP